MPIKKPRKNEKRRDFIPRCTRAISGEFDDNKQAVAVCFDAWKNRNKKRRRKTGKALSANSATSGGVLVGENGTEDIEEDDGLPVNEMGWTATETAERVEFAEEKFTQDEVSYTEDNVDTPVACRNCYFYQPDEVSNFGSCQVVENDIAWFGTCELFISSTEQQESELDKLLRDGDVDEAVEKAGSAEKAVAAFIMGLSNNRPRSVFWNPRSKSAVVRLREQDDSLRREWRQRIQQLLGADDVEETNLEQPPEWGQGSDWVMITQEGDVQPDPGLESEPVEETPEPAPEAIEARWNGRIVKTHDGVDDDGQEFTFILGPVLVPESVDLQGDIIDSDEIRKAAHDFMEHSQVSGEMHKRMLARKDVVIVESYQAPVNFRINKTNITGGSWMVGMRVYDPDLRRKVLSGEYTGFSIGGTGQRIAVDE